MRNIAPIAAVVVTLLPSAAFAQQAAGTVGTSPPPAPVVSSPSTTATQVVPQNVAPNPGSPWYPDTRTGLDKVASNGIATKTVKAVPCSAAARETDGFSTCVGIPRGSIR